MRASHKGPFHSNVRRANRLAGPRPKAAGWLIPPDLRPANRVAPRRPHSQTEKQGRCLPAGARAKRFVMRNLPAGQRCGSPTEITVRRGSAGTRYRMVTGASSSALYSSPDFAARRGKRKTGEEIPHFAATAKLRDAGSGLRGVGRLGLEHFLDIRIFQHPGKSGIGFCGREILVAFVPRFAQINQATVLVARLRE